MYIKEDMVVFEEMEFIFLKYYSYHIVHAFLKLNVNKDEKQIHVSLHGFRVIGCETELFNKSHVYKSLVTDISITINKIPFLKMENSHRFSLNI